MYAITGITGKVGGELGRRLLTAGEPVRAVVRDPAKGDAWAERGCEVSHAEIEDGTRLAAAFAGAEAVFVLPPPGPGYPEARRVIDAVVSGLAAARPNRVLCLSTIGADAPRDNLLTRRTLLEQALRGLGIPVTFLRQAWFMENAQWDLATARDEGVLHSFLQPADKSFPMVNTRDIGALAAELIRQDWTGERTVGLEGPARVSPRDLAHTHSPPCSGARSASRSCRANRGKRCSARRECGTRSRASGCSMASTRAGSRSRRAATLSPKARRR
jgi:uncharacterized protein YbjT (DUF2867 family)